MRRAWLTLLSIATGVLGVASAHAQVSQLQFDAAKVPQGTVLHYQKSMLDGSRSTHVSVYVVDRERVESLKWDDDATAATLVKARIDWSTFSVSEFQSLHLEQGKRPEVRGTLAANGTQLTVSFLNGKVVAIHHWPWHSYDFDFASLGLTLPHVRDPEADFTFWRTDVVFVGDDVDFAELGEVRLRFEGGERRERAQLRRYAIGGAGLMNRDGQLWTDAATGLIVEYRIPLGDEPGYSDVRLVLDAQQKMTPAQWEAFKKAKVGER